MSVTVGSCLNEIAFPNEDRSVLFLFFLYVCVLFLIFICLGFRILINCLVWLGVYDFKCSYLFFDECMFASMWVTIRGELYFVFGTMSSFTFEIFISHVLFLVNCLCLDSSSPKHVYGFDVLCMITVST